MAYVIKRYANRKLYDTRTKRYLTLDEVAVLVRAGEEVRVEDADSGDDLTAPVLAKIVAEGGRGGGPLVSQGTLVDLIRRPSEMMLDAVRSSVSAGQKTVEQMSGEVGKVFETVAGYAGKGRKQVEGAGEEVARVIERRLQSLLEELNVATRDDVAALRARVAELEAKVKKAKKRTAVAKATPPKKAAAKPAARRTTRTRTARS
jgi:polyhydroxyalkanoate synthesis repressor PhaR